MATFKLDRVAFREHVLNAPWMVEEMRGRAERGAEFARSIAPVDEASPEPGRYRDSITADAHTYGGVNHDRAVGIVSSDVTTADGKANLSVIVEFGTEKQDGHHVMGRTLDALGQ